MIAVYSLRVQGISDGILTLWCMYSTSKDDLSYLQELPYLFQ